MRTNILLIVILLLVQCVNPNYSQSSEHPRLVIQSQNSEPTEKQAFSPDGKIIATASVFPREVVFWEIASRKVIRKIANISNFAELEGEDDDYDVGFSANGKYFVASDSHQAVWIVDISSGKLIKKFRLKTNGYSSFAFLDMALTNDLKFLVRNYSDLRETYEIPSGRRIKKTVQHLPKEYDAISQNRKYGIKDDRGSRKDISKISLDVFNIEENRLIRSFQLREITLHYALSPNGDFIATTDERTGVTTLLSVASGEPIATLEGFANRVNTFFAEKRLLSLRSIAPVRSFYANGRTRERQNVRILIRDEISGDEADFDGYEGTYGINFTVTPDEKNIVLDSESGIKIIEIQTLKQIVNWNGISPDLLLATIWGGPALDPLPPGRLSPKGTYLIANDSILEISTGIKKFAYETPGPEEDWSQVLEFSPDESYFISNCIFDKNGSQPASESNRETSLWNPKTGEKTSKPNLSKSLKNLAEASFSPDGKTLAVAKNIGEMNSGANIELWDVANDKQIRTLAKGLVNNFGSLIFSPNGNLLAGAGYDGRIRVWHVANGQKIMDVYGHTDDTSVSFSDDGKLLLSDSSDLTAKIWDVESGRELCRLVKFINGDWIVSTLDGRFDTNNLDEVIGIHWIIPSEPLRPLPVEILSRQYYEPNLLQRVLKCNSARVANGPDPCDKFKPLPPIGEIKRVQPKIAKPQISRPITDHMSRQEP